MRGREASYAREGMASFLDTVYRSMRLVTQLYGCLYVLNSSLLVVGRRAVDLAVARQGGRRSARSPSCIGLVLRI